MGVSDDDYIRVRLPLDYVEVIFSDGDGHRDTSLLKMQALEHFRDALTEAQRLLRKNNFNDDAEILGSIEIDYNANIEIN